MRWDDYLFVRPNYHHGSFYHFAFIHHGCIFTFHHNHLLRISYYRRIVIHKINPYNYSIITHDSEDQFPAPLVNNFQSVLEQHFTTMNNPQNNPEKEPHKHHLTRHDEQERLLLPPVSAYPAELQSQLVDYLSTFMTSRRNELFRQIVSQRTRYITVVLEDIFQSHNASAVLRSCECFGIQDVHLIENKYQYQLNRDVSLGSWKWLSLNHHADTADNTTACLSKLKADGYRIVATSPHKQYTTPDKLDLEKGKIALLFGTELDGLSEQALSMADEFVRIPMVGFTESFNISVSAALFCHQLTDRLRKSNLKWQLDDDEMTSLLLGWMRNSIRMSSTLENKFIENASFHKK